MKFLSLILLLCSLPALGQISYTARTDVVPQPYPGTIPCPGVSCVPGGSRLGSNFLFSPSDFGTQYLRVTDRDTPSNSTHSFTTNCGGSAESNIWDISISMFYVCDPGTSIRIFSFNSAGPATTLRYASPYVIPGCGSGTTSNFFFSFVIPKFGYATCFNAAGDPVIEKINFSDLTGPTVANGRMATLVDLATCVPALAGVGNLVYLDDVAVSKDDQTFTLIASTTVGQGSSGVIYNIVWNQTLGCRVWNSNTQLISGAYGGAPTGAVSFTGDGVTPPVTSPMILHNARMSPGGQWVKVTVNGGVPAELYWNIATLNIYQGFDNSTHNCGHSAIGVTKSINQCAGGPPNQFQNYWIRPNNSPGSQTQLPSVLPAPTIVPWDSHESWPTDNSIDTNPIFSTSVIGQFTPRGAWDNEILALATDGTGRVWRFGHTYATNLSQYFGPKNAIGIPSPDGKYFLFATDWNGMLGHINGLGTSCVIGTSCATDVFIVILPIVNNPCQLIGQSALHGTGSLK